MKKFKFLVGYGLKKRILRKAFLFANIAIAVILIAVINLPTIIGWFSSGDEGTDELNVVVHNQTDITGFTDDLETMLNEPYGDQNFFILDEGTDAFSEDGFWDNEAEDVAIILTGDLGDPVIDLYSKDPDFNPQIMDQIELLLVEYQIDDYQRPGFNTHFAPDYEDPDEEMAVSSMMNIIILPLFILIIMGTQLVGTEIIEEKSTKAIETIISSVPANIHFLSKITASILFVIIQGLLVLAYGGLGVVFGNASQMSMPGGGEVHLLKYVAELIPDWPVVLLIALSFMVIGTLFYLIIAALFASMATTQEDYQQIQAPLMLTLLAGFYIGIFAPMAGAEGFMKIMAFVPIFTPIIAPVAYASGAMTALEAGIALFLMTGVLIAALYFIAPIYRVAILSYDQTKFGKRIRSYVHKAFAKNGKPKQ